MGSDIGKLVQFLVASNKIGIPPLEFAGVEPELLLGLLAFGNVAYDPREKLPVPSFTSLTARSMGNVVPSLRRPVTSRPMPIIFFSPVRM